MKGIIVDIGGKKLNKRGTFRPTQGNDSDLWLYLNIDSSAEPDAVTDAHDIPLMDNSVDCVICCEVLEHVEDPKQCCNEIARVLKDGGVLILSIPFLYPVHADPYDFQRLTPEGIRKACSSFSKIEIIPMGSWIGTLGMIAEIGAREIRWQQLRIVITAIARMAVLTR